MMRETWERTFVTESVLLSSHNVSAWTEAESHLMLVARPNHLFTCELGVLALQLCSSMFCFDEHDQHGTVTSEPS